MKNKFDTPKFVDHSIFDLDDKKIGELRVKPNAIFVEACWPAQKVV